MGVVLQQLVGRRWSKRHKKEIEVKRPVDLIIRDDIRLGQIARHSDAEVIFIQDGTLLSEPEQRDIIEAVRQIRAEAENKYERWTVRDSVKIRQPPSEEAIDQGVEARTAKRRMENPDEEEDDDLAEDRAEQNEPAEKASKNRKKK